VSLGRFPRSPDTFVVDPSVKIMNAKGKVVRIIKDPPHVPLDTSYGDVEMAAESRERGAKKLRRGYQRNRKHIVINPERPRQPKHHVPLLKPCAFKIGARFQITGGHVGQPGQIGTLYRTTGRRFCLEVAGGRRGTLRLKISPLRVKPLSAA